MSIAPILAVNFVGTLGFSIVIPFLVFLVTRWGGNALVYGLVGATYSAFQLVGAPLLGRWSDRVGRKRVLLVSQLGTLAAWILFALAFALPTETLMRVDSGILGAFSITAPLLLLLVARALDGLTGGNVSVANAYLADVTPDEDRSVNFGRMAVTGNLGFIVGPALAGILGATLLGELLPVLVALGISVVTSLLILFGLPDSRPRPVSRGSDASGLHRVMGQEEKDCYAGRGQGSSFRDLFRLECVGVLLVVQFLVMLGFNVFYVAFPVHAVVALEWSVTETGIFFSVMSLTMALVQGPVLGRVARRYRDVHLVIAGSLILATSFLAFLSGALPVIYLGVVLLSVGNGIMWPTAVALLSRAAGDRYQGATQGLAGSLGAVASILGLLVGGVLYGELGAQVFIISATAIFVVSLLMLRVTRSPRLRQPAQPATA